MISISKTFGLFLCFALVAVTSVDAEAKRRWPTRAQENETIEESIARLQYDEAMGKRRIAQLEAEQKKILGADRFAAFQNGKCEKFKCARGLGRVIATRLESQKQKVKNQLSEISQERMALQAMYAQTNQPIAANTLVQPGVSQNMPQAIAGSTTTNPSPLQDSMQAERMPATESPSQAQQTAQDTAAGLVGNQVDQQISSSPGKGASK